MVWYGMVWYGMVCMVPYSDEPLVSVCHISLCGGYVNPREACGSQFYCCKGISWALEITC